MGQVIVCQFVTLDGVVEDPDGSAGTPWGGWAWRFGPEVVAGDKFDMGPVLDTGVKVVGRATWELFARIFPSRTDDFSRKLNVIEKLVVSRSLTADRHATWANSTLLEGDLLAEVRRRRESQDVMVTGSGSVVDQLVAHDLVDQYRLMVFPVVIGKGHRLFESAPTPFDLHAVSVEDLGRGVVRQVLDRRRTA